jgi:hypothetical protein
VTPRPEPRRTPADAARAAANRRAAQDLATCQAIWPQAPSWRISELQWRLDNGKNRKENGQ